MRKDFFEIALYAHQHDLYVALASNGTLVTPEVAKSCTMPVSITWKYP